MPVFLRCRLVHICGSEAVDAVQYTDNTKSKSLPDVNTPVNKISQLVYSGLNEE